MPGCGSKRFTRWATIARPPLSAESEQLLIKALDHYDPAVRAGAARVAGRLQVKRRATP